MGKKKAEYEKKKAAWMERQSTKPELPINKGAADKSAPREARLAKDWDSRSDISLASTAASAAHTLTCEQELEVQAVVAKDKAVRRLEKLLREIANLEQSADLDVLQQKKSQSEVRARVGVGNCSWSCSSPCEEPRAPECSLGQDGLSFSVVLNQCTGGECHLVDKIYCDFFRMRCTVPPRSESLKRGSKLFNMQLVQSLNVLWLQCVVTHVLYGQRV